MINSNFAILGFILTCLGYIGYTIDTLKGETRPNRVSWLLWTLVPMIAFAAQLNEDVGIQALLTFSVGFGPFVVLLASFVNSKSVWQITRFDIICGILSLLGLLGWIVTRHGDVAIFFSIVSDGLAAVPTVRKSWTDPKSESWVLYLLVAISSIITLLTIESFTFANTGFAVYVLGICSILFALIYFKPGLRLRKKSRA